jgi:hypothetical protein
MKSLAPVVSMKIVSPLPSGPASARAVRIYIMGKINGQMNKAMIQLG